MFKLNDQQSRIQAALEEIKKIIKNPEIQFGTTKHEAIGKQLQDKDDLKSLLSVKFFCKYCNYLKISYNVI